MKTYKLITEPGSETLAQLDGTPIECIYKNPVILPHPNLHGQMIIKATLCNNRCPAFEFLDRHPLLNGNSKAVHLHCCKLTVQIKQE
jgi:hypothetical protein